MNADAILFGVLAVVLVGSALAVVLTKNLFHSVLWLALALTGTAGIFLTLDAEFLAAVQLLLYAGGVITIVVFAIVVTERLVGERLSQTSRRIVPGALVAAAIAYVVICDVIQTPLAAAKPAFDVDLTKLIGETVMTHFALAFELLAVLLLTALVGAIYLARPEE
jgi:NADH-quinone oxidoreductase subunit J